MRKCLYLPKPNLEPLQGYKEYKLLYFGSVREEGFYDL